MPLNDEKLTLKAARFMREQGLVMRNSNTEQVSSLHYQGNQRPRSHGVGGIYSVPLWTIAIKGLLESIDSPDQISEKIHHHQSQYVEDLGGFVDILDPQLSDASPLEQQNHLDSFLKAIKDFIRTYTAFSIGMHEAYDYELLVGNISSSINGWSMPGVDDLGRYPTGGRCSGYRLSPSNIIFRIGFNHIEIEFFKKILAHAYDSQIFANSPTNNADVGQSARIYLCNQLAVEIISTKLVRYLNTGGNLKTVICLSQSELDILLGKVIEKNQASVKEWIENARISYLLGKDFFVNKNYPVSEHAEPASNSASWTFNRYKTRLYQKFPSHTSQLDKLRDVYFSLQEQIPGFSISDSRCEAAKNLLDAIENFCKRETFEEDELALLLIRYHRLQRSKTNDISASIAQNGNQPFSQFNWNIVSGFLLVMGTSAVALALTLLTGPVMGITLGIGLSFSALGVYGLFSSTRVEEESQLLCVQPKKRS
jgi:hypothetical protein